MILVAVDMMRGGGSESGRAWDWAFALSRWFRLHVVTSPSVVARCRHEPAAAGWTWHTTVARTPRSTGWRYYWEYVRWGMEVPRTVRRVIAATGACHLHHITLGSFRFLPRYDRCGIPYSLGPLAGGEFTPRALLGEARLPAGPWLGELVRPAINRGFTCLAGARAVARSSELALATSLDSERILRSMGARRTVVVFPDRVPPDLDQRNATDTGRRVADLRRRVRLVWSGRAVWWKGGQLAIELLRRLLAAGVDAELTFFTQGSALPEWRRLVSAAGVSGRCRINGLVPHAELHAALGKAHVFVYPTLHDSSCPALLEAYALGLPSLTVGLGGPAMVATPETGFNLRPTGLDAWIDGAVACIHGWQLAPESWLRASEAARARAGNFGGEYLDELVERVLVAPFRRNWVSESGEAGTGVAK